MASQFDPEAWVREAERLGVTVTLCIQADHSRGVYFGYPRDKPVDYRFFAPLNAPADRRENFAALIGYLHLSGRFAVAPKMRASQ